jgi:hypothetical protein
MTYNAAMKDRNYAFAVILMTIVQLAAFGVFLPAFAEANQPPLNAIPTQVRAVLGCDDRIRGNGIGLDGKAEEMLAGYSTPSVKGRAKISVFWCALTVDRFWLVFVQGGQLMHPECSPILDWHYSPKGLSLSTESRPLNEFVYVDGSGRAGPSGKRTAGSIVVDGDDSLSKEFYCYKGRWMVRILD